MAFQPFEFNYIPPATVVATVNTGPAVSAAASSSNTSNTPLATNAKQSLLNLAATNLYLQNILLNSYANTGVTIDPNTDPVTAQALAACYNGQVPPIVTTAMYSNLLDCQYALQLINQNAGLNSSIEADPVMLSNLLQINNAVYNSLLNDGGSAQVNIQTLAILKTNALLMTNLAFALDVYKNGTDLSPTIASNLNTLINNEQALAASAFTLFTTANTVVADLGNVLNSYVLQPVADIVRITAAINMLYHLNYKTETKKVFDGLGTIAATLLMSEVSIIYFAADQVAQRLLAPLKNITGSMGGILQAANRANFELQQTKNLTKTNLSNVGSQGISGMPNCNPCSSNVLKGLSGSSAKSIKTPDALLKLSSGVQFLGQTISAAQTAINKEFNTIESSFIALQKRRNKDFADVLQLSCAMSAAESLMTIGNQIVNLQTPSASGAQTVSNTSITQSVNTALGTTTPSSPLPTMPSNVKSTLVAGGATINV